MTDHTAPAAIADELEGRLVSSALRRDHPIGSMTTYRVGGRAAVFVELDDERDVATVAAVTARHRCPVLVLGRGSNLLVADEGFDGLVLHLGERFAGVAAGDSSAMVTAGAAAPLPTLARRLTADGRRGFEWAVGVPGSLGGAVRMNAGGHGSDMTASLVSAHIVDLATGDEGEVCAHDLELGYRHSSVRDDQLVLAATLELEPVDPAGVAEGTDLVADIVRWRREHQPGGQNAGSVFTNPAGDSAGRLIDAAGLKGLRIGSAAVSEKHANFIQADPGGRAADVAAVMHEIVDRVEDRFGVVLHPETHLIGFAGEEWHR